MFVCSYNPVLSRYILNQSFRLTLNVRARRFIKETVKHETFTFFIFLLLKCNGNLNDYHFQTDYIHLSVKQKMTEHYKGGNKNNVHNSDDSFRVLKMLGEKNTHQKYKMLTRRDSIHQIILRGHFRIFSKFPTIE